MDKKDLLARASDIAYLIRQWNDGDGRPVCEDAVLIAPDVIDALLEALPKRLNREILFRGKRLDNNEWVEGDLGHNILGEECICCWNGGTYQAYRIDPATRGEFTGMIDERGVKVFEGDIVEECASMYGVIWRQTIAGFSIENRHQQKADPPIEVERMEVFDHIRATVIGNIYDNPDWLEDS